MRSDSPVPCKDLEVPVSTSSFSLERRRNLLNHQSSIKHSFSVSFLQEKPQEKNRWLFWKNNSSNSDIQRKKPFEFFRKLFRKKPASPTLKNEKIEYALNTSPLAITPIQIPKYSNSIDVNRFDKINSTSVALNDMDTSSVISESEFHRQRIKRLSRFRKSTSKPMKQIKKLDSGIIVNKSFDDNISIESKNSGSSNSESSNIDSNEASQKSLMNNVGHVSDSESNDENELPNVPLLQSPIAEIMPKRNSSLSDLSIVMDYLPEKSIDSPVARNLNSDVDMIDTYLQESDNEISSVTLSQFDSVDPTRPTRIANMISSSERKLSARLLNVVKKFEDPKESTIEKIDIIEGYVKDAEIITPEIPIPRLREFKTPNLGRPFTELGGKSSPQFIRNTLERTRSVRALDSLMSCIVEFDIDEKKESRLTDEIVDANPTSVAKEIHVEKRNSVRELKEKFELLGQ